MFRLGHNNMNKHKISNKLQKILTKDILIKEYCINKLSTWKIAENYNCSKFFVLKHLNKYNINRRNKSESLLGHFVSDQTRLNQSISHKGKISNFKNHKHTKEARLLISQSLQGKYGELARNWQNGLSFFPYSIEFNKKLKQKIRERDNFTCQYCELKEKNYYRNLDVHHIDYNKDNCNKLNLITLCQSYNCIANGNRDYWFAYYTYIIENYKRRNSMERKLNSDFKIISANKLKNIKPVTKEQLRKLIKKEFNELIENKDIDFELDYNLENPFRIIKFSIKEK